MGFFDWFKTKEHDQFDDKGNILCPKCHSEGVIKIIYGLPSDELIKESRQGKFALGGCCVDESNPNWECHNCDNRF